MILERIQPQKPFGSRPTDADVQAGSTAARPEEIRVSPAIIEELDRRLAQLSHKHSK